MKRSVLGRAALLIAIGLAAMLPPSQVPRLGARTPGEESHRSGVKVIPVSLGTEDDPDAQAEMEFMMLRDPRTGTIRRRISRRTGPGQIQSSLGIARLRRH